jgi:ferredoxin-NADP reductase/MOSC domain-containing protein YiiM/ferredoxin
MARLLSVNVGLPRDIQWKGRTVHTGIWKKPVVGRCRVGKLNLEGDGQGDLAGHGGEQRAVFVYQIESHQYWQEQLKRTDFVYGEFGENFTVEGLSDDIVCIGDRYQIGSALFEVTQPRVTCYRVGIRTNEPRMPALLTGSGRPGFYFRVLQEGTVGTGDEIVKVEEAKEGMSVAEINALLYSPNHPRDRLKRAMAIKALSPGWRSSFEALLQSGTSPTESGNAGLMPASAAHPVKSGFRRLVVTSTDQESADVLSLTMKSSDDQPLQIALPGQYLVLRLQAARVSSPLYRSYSLSGPPSTEQYRISVKLEPNGVAGAYLRHHVGVGDILDVSLPRGNFVLQSGERPVVLISAGIGATPLLAMLHELAGAQITRQVTWIHGVRDRQHHPFAREVRRLIRALPHGRSVVFYSRPGPDEKLGENFDMAGHLSLSVLREIDVPRDGDFYLCGPARFMSDVRAALANLGVPPAHVHLEIFDGSEPMTPGIVGTPTPSPHLPDNDGGTGPLVSFARSGIAVHWNAAVYQSILDLAEACDVPVRWSCRTGVCHNCESGLVAGDVSYTPDPLDPPADGNVLICCARPQGDIVIDL